MNAAQYGGRARLLRAALCAALALGVLQACGGSDGQSDGQPDGQNGQTTPSVTQSQGGFAYAVSYGPDGSTLASAVYPFSVGADGSLASGSQGSVSVPGESADIVADPSGRYLYTINMAGPGSSGSASISQFAVSEDGTLTPLSPASVALPDPTGEAYAATVDPAGHFLYVVGLDGGAAQSVSELAIGSDGTLSALNPATLSVPIATTQPHPIPLVLDSSGVHAYLAGGNQVLQLTVASDGTLSAPSATPVAGMQVATGFTLAPDGQHAYVAGFSCESSGCPGLVALFTVASTGALTATASTLPMTQIPLQLLFDPADSSIAYLLSSDGQAAGIDAIAKTNLLQYAVDSSGMLTASGGSAAASFDFAALEASVFGSSVYTLGTPPGPAITPPSGLGTYRIGAQGVLTAAPVTTVPGVAAGVAFVAAR